MSEPIITFLSDFGSNDWFAGVVHGVLHSIHPRAHVVDLSHAIPPGMVNRAAFVLEAAAADFPPGTVHLVVVDPGVGTLRRALAVQARGQSFVGPDNGVLEWALADPQARIHELAEPRFFRHPVSRTFHGRDIFAPVAAHMASGVPLEQFGPRVDDPVRLLPNGAVHRDGEVVGRVVFVDRFGNLLTNVTEQDLSDGFPTIPDTRIQVLAFGRVIRGLSRSYGDAPVGTILALIGSSGRLEIAQVGGDASERLGLGEGDFVRVRIG
jgi:S-adenosylmethionine hydrolase